MIATGAKWPIYVIIYGCSCHIARAEYLDRERNDNLELPNGRTKTRTDMRLSLLGLLLAGLTESRSTSTPIYVFDGRSDQVDRREVPAINPEVSRLLFSQQLGISQYHSLDALDDSTISYLNQHKSQERLLAQSSSDASDVAKLLVFVEGVENAQGIASMTPLRPSKLQI